MRFRYVFLTLVPVCLLGACSPVASISVTIPPLEYVDRESDFPITWQSANAPSGSRVYLSLLRADSDTGGGIITDIQSTGGSYVWRIPAANDRAMIGGDYRLHGVDIANGVSYKVRVTVYIPTIKQCYEGCPPSMGTVITSADSATFVIGDRF